MTQLDIAYGSNAITAVWDYEDFMVSKGYSERTRSVRVAFARSRIEEWGLEGFNAERIRQWLDRPELGGWSRATYHSHLKDLCEFLVASNYIEGPSPIDGIRKPRPPRGRPRPLTEDEVQRALAAADSRTRDWLLLALLAGLRVHEIAKLRGEDVHEDFLRVVGKGRKEALLPTHPEVWAMAQRYPREGYWFTSHMSLHIQPNTISAYVSALFGSLGIEGSIHRCRHTYGTRLLRSGVNIRIVQELMRHANLETTAAYAAVSDDEMRGAIHLLPGA